MTGAADPSVGTRWSSAREQAGVSRTPPARLVVEDLRGGVAGHDIVRGVSFEISAGEVHAVMGPNGSGKSTVANLIMGRPGYSVTGGSVRLEVGGEVTDLLSQPTWRRAQAGLFMAMQKPTEVPGVSLEDALTEAFSAGGRDRALVRMRMEEEAVRIGFDLRFLERPLNVDLSGGERKRNEALQLGVLEPRFAILDEIDSGLDIDALRAVARRVEDATQDFGVGVLAITHFARLLHELRADRIHVLLGGQVVASGGPELAEELERVGYSAFGHEVLDDGAGGDGGAGSVATGTGGGPDPFADPLAGL